MRLKRYGRRFQVDAQDIVDNWVLCEHHHVFFALPDGYLVIYDKRGKEGCALVKEEDCPIDVAVGTCRFCEREKKRGTKELAEYDQSMADYYDQRRRMKDMGYME